MFIYIKTIILVNILGVCIYLGNLKAKSFDNRVYELMRIKNALSMFKTKLQFTYEPIKDIFSEISHIVYKDTDNIFIKTIYELENNSISEAWYRAIDMNKSDLNKEDTEIIKMLGKLLGRTDIEGQISEIDLTSSFIDKQIKKAEYEKNKNAKLYKTLGTVLGLVIVILLI